MGCFLTWNFIPCGFHQKHPRTQKKLCIRLWYCRSTRRGFDTFLEFAVLSVPLGLRRGVEAPTSSLDASSLRRVLFCGNVLCKLVYARLSMQADAS